MRWELPRQKRVRKKRSATLTTSYPSHLAKPHTLRVSERYAIVSAMGASPDSRSFYYRTKGEVERDIQEIGFTSLTICRPEPYQRGRRNEARAAEGERR